DLRGRFPGVAADDDRFAAGKHRSDLAADDADGGRVQRELARVAAQTVGSEELHFASRLARGSAVGGACNSQASRHRPTTVTICPCRTRTPGASARTVAATERLPLRCSIEIGSVVTLVIFESARAGPYSVAVRGSAVISATSQPGAGFPVTLGRTGSV